MENNSIKKEIDKMNVIQNKSSNKVKLSFNKNIFVINNKSYKIENENKILN